MMAESWNQAAMSTIKKSCEKNIAINVRLARLHRRKIKAEVRKNNDMKKVLK